MEKRDRGTFSGGESPMVAVGRGYDANGQMTKLTIDGGLGDEQWLLADGQRTVEGRTDGRRVSWPQFACLGAHMEIHDDWEVWTEW